jgi:hypothetical protein
MIRDQLAIRIYYVRRLKVQVKAKLCDDRSSECRDLVSVPMIFYVSSNAHAAYALIGRIAFNVYSSAHY